MPKATPGGKAIHANASSEWYSPPDVSGGFVHVFRQRPDVDPASSEIANTAIRAKLFFSSNGLDLSRWPTGKKKAVCNPPSPPKLWWMALSEWALRHGEQNAALYVAYSIEQLQQSQIWTPEHPAMSFPHCVPKRRVRFWCRAFDALQKLNKRIDGIEEGLASASLALEEAGDAGLAKDTEIAESLSVEISEWEAKLKPLDKRRKALEALDPDELVPGDQPTHASAYVLLGANAEETQRFEDYYTEIGSVVIP